MGLANTDRSQHVDLWYCLRNLSSVLIWGLVELPTAAKVLRSSINKYLLFHTPVCPIFFIDNQALFIDNNMNKGAVWPPGQQRVYSEGGEAFPLWHCCNSPCDSANTSIIKILPLSWKLGFVYLCLISFKLQVHTLLISPAPAGSVYQSLSPVHSCIMHSLIHALSLFSWIATLCSYLQEKNLINFLQILHIYWGFLTSTCQQNMH